MKSIPFVIACLLPAFSLAQFHGTDPVLPRDISDWTVADVSEYNGTYHFGFSEEESSLQIVGDEALRTAQLRYFVWGQDRWLDTFVVFTNVRISGNTFQSEEARGRFVEFRWQGETKRGLLIENPWSYAVSEGGEIGNKEDIPIEGKYPQASTQVLTVDYLEKLSSDALRIMRNEIFARYGYRFRKGGEMDRYFSEQPWYVATYGDVNPFLTPIEEENIARILTIEKGRKGN